VGIGLSTLQCQEISAKKVVNVSMIFFEKVSISVSAILSSEVAVSISAITFESIVNNTGCCYFRYGMLIYVIVNFLEIQNVICHTLAALVE